MDQNNNNKMMYTPVFIRTERVLTNTHVYVWNKNRENTTSYYLINAFSRSIEYFIIIYKDLDSPGVCLSLVTGAAWVRFPASACGRLVVAHPRSMVFSGFSGFPHHDRPQYANIRAVENASLSSIALCVIEVK